MRDGLSALHDPDNSGLRLVIAIRSDTFVGLLILLFSLFGLNLVDFDAVPRVGEIEIHCESVGVIDIFTFWLFSKNAEPSAGKGLERPLEFRVVCGLLAGLREGAQVTQDVIDSTYQGQKRLLSRDMTSCHSC